MAILHEAQEILLDWLLAGKWLFIGNATHKTRRRIWVEPLRFITRLCRGYGGKTSYLHGSEYIKMVYENLKIVEIKHWLVKLNRQHRALPLIHIL